MSETMKAYNVRANDVLMAGDDSTVTVHDAYSDWHDGNGKVVIVTSAGEIRLDPDADVERVA